MGVMACDATEFAVAPEVALRLNEPDRLEAGQHWVAAAHLSGVGPVRMAVALTAETQ